MTPEAILFYIFAAGALGTSAAVVALRNPLMSALALILDFFFFAGLYVLLSAHFMAVIQILVYGGAIMVLFMFIIMLLNLRDDELENMKFRVHHLLAAAVTVGFIVIAVNATSAILDRGAIKQQRAQSQDVEAPLIKTKSRVPGLYADLNEDGLEDEFSNSIRALEMGDSSALDVKYPRTSKKPIVVPPILKGENIRGGKVDPPTFGTAETVSVLLVNRFVIPFELTAILLLGAIIGAVIIAKKRL